LSEVHNGDVFGAETNDYYATAISKASLPPSSTWQTKQAGLAPVPRISKRIRPRWEGAAAVAGPAGGVSVAQPGPPPSRPPPSAAADANTDDADADTTPGEHLFRDADSGSGSAAEVQEQIEALSEVTVAALCCSASAPHHELPHNRISLLGVPQMEMKAKGGVQRLREEMKAKDDERAGLVEKVKDAVGKYRRLQEQVCTYAPCREVEWRSDW
jgi:hypothetical protein